MAADLNVGVCESVNQSISNWKEFDWQCRETESSGVSHTACLCHANFSL